MPEEKPTIFISISIGWAVRNYFHTGIIDALSERYRIVVFTTKPISDALIRQGYGEIVELRIMGQEQEPRRWRLFRQLKKKIYMESRRCSTELIWEKYSRRPRYQRIGGWAIRRLTRFVPAVTLLHAVETLDFRINRDSALTGLFRRSRPLFLFATHASSFLEERLLRSAVRAGVPVHFMVLSWDHLSSKIIMSRRYHTVFVWNEITKREILETYPSYRPDQIKIVGAPQFDGYAQSPALNYDAWCRAWGLDPSRKTILFTTAPDVRHDQQHLIVQELGEHILRGDGVPRDLQIFLKCHPFDLNPNYEPLSRKYPVAVYRPSADIADPQENWIPSRDEMQIARDCLAFCCMNMNIFSTVTLEAALLDKPIIHIAFDPLPVVNRIPCREYYNFDHFKRVVDMDASLLVGGYDELFKAINTYLENPSHKAAQRKRLAETFLSHWGESTAQLVREIHALADSKPVQNHPGE